MIPRFSGIVVRSIWVSRKSVTKSVTELDMVPWGLGEAIFGVGLSKNRDLVCFEIFDFGRSGEVRRIAVR